MVLNINFQLSVIIIQRKAKNHNSKLKTFLSILNFKFFFCFFIFLFLLHSMQDKKDENQYIKQYIQILNFELWLCVLRYPLYANTRDRDSVLHFIFNTNGYLIGQLVNRSIGQFFYLVFETNDYSLFTND
jgi:hypothetical protein